MKLDLTPNAERLALFHYLMEGVLAGKAPHELVLAHTLGMQLTDLRAAEQELKEKNMLIRKCDCPEH